VLQALLQAVDKAVDGGRLVPRRLERGDEAEVGHGETILRFGRFEQAFGSGNHWRPGEPSRDARAGPGGAC
jgi:hypothetical protein